MIGGLGVAGLLGGHAVGGVGRQVARRDRPHVGGGRRARRDDAALDGDVPERELRLLDGQRHGAGVRDQRDLAGGPPLRAGEERDVAAGLRTRRRSACCAAGGRPRRRRSAPRRAARPGTPRARIGSCGASGPPRVGVRWTSDRPRAAGLIGPAGRVPRMRLEPLYRTVFRYPDGGRGTVLEGEAGSEGHYFFVAEGAVEGRVTGTPAGRQPPALARGQERAARHPGRHRDRRRGDDHLQLPRLRAAVPAGGPPDRDRRDPRLRRRALRVAQRRRVRRHRRVPAPARARSRRAASSARRWTS